MKCPCGTDVIVFGHIAIGCPLTTRPVQAGNHFPCDYCREVIELREAERRAASQAAA